MLKSFGSEEIKAGSHIKETFDLLRGKMEKGDLIYPNQITAAPKQLLVSLYLEGKVINFVGK